MASGLLPNSFKKLASVSRKQNTIKCSLLRLVGETILIFFSKQEDEQLAVLFSLSLYRRFLDSTSGVFQIRRPKYTQEVHLKSVKNQLLHNLHWMWHAPSPHAICKAHRLFMSWRGKVHKLKINLFSLQVIATQACGIELTFQSAPVSARHRRGRIDRNSVHPFCKISGLSSRTL